MWRDDPRDDDRRAREVGRGPSTSADDPRLHERDPRDAVMRDLNVPRERTRDEIRIRGDVYTLRASEARTLATAGAFRAVLAGDLRDQHGRALDARHHELRHLRERGLVRTTPYMVGRTRATMVTLTDRGRDVLDAMRRSPEADRAQRFYAGIAKPRELAHDVMLHRAYLRSAERIVAQGGRIQRVRLDAELKREYQQFLQAPNRSRRDSTGRTSRTEREIADWAAAHGLPAKDGHVQFPDVRIEYEDRDGIDRREDLEVETPHYRGAHAAAKAGSGFTRYSTAGPRVGGLRGGGGRSSGAPFDPGFAEDLL